MSILLLIGLALWGGDAAPRQANAAGNVEQTLIAMERQSWVAWQRQDVEFWRGFLSEDHVEVHNMIGATGREQVISGIARRLCTVSDYALDHFTFRRFGADTALLVYRAAQTTECGGHRVPSPVWATSLYQRRHGRWVNVLYVHTPIPSPPPGS